MRIQEWGRGIPVVALHPLALESTAFAGVGEALADHGFHTLAIDLPGFGETPIPDDAALTPAYLAKPVVKFARSLGEKPIVLGMSMGGRVAIEALLEAPDAFRGGVFVAPYLPWTSHRRFLRAAHWIDPDWANHIRLETIWPLLERIALFLDGLPAYENDWITRSAARVVYHSACPATRHAFFSAARELALDPAFGPRGLWTRIAEIAAPTTFVWGARDWLIPTSHADHIQAAVETSARVDVACAAHVWSGAHFLCMQNATVEAVVGVVDGRTRAESDEQKHAECLVETAQTGDTPFDPQHPAHSSAGG
jgi:pimeloyl-ACP methyl ester carboxylesterase